jgi:hypothetical protein
MGGEKYRGKRVLEGTEQTKVKYTHRETLF